MHTKITGGEFVGGEFARGELTGMPTFDIELQPSLRLALILYMQNGIRVHPTKYILYVNSAKYKI